MELQTKSHTIASVGTVLVLAVLFLVLWFTFLKAPQPEQDEGIEVSFSEEMDMKAAPSSLAGAAPSAPKQMSEPVETEPASEMPQLAQQDDSPAQTTPPKKEEPKQDDEAKKIQQQKQQQQQREQQAIANAKRMGDLFSNFGSEDNSNDQTGGTDASSNGNPLGHGSSNGNEWNLDGRSLIGALPKPSTDFKQEGKVVVRIIVDKDGNVKSAQAAQGTTISDEATRQLAVKAAMKAKFNMVNQPQATPGTITYYFKFK